MTAPTGTNGGRIVATYDLHATGSAPDVLAATIALEQTVEVPRSLADAAGLPPGHDLVLMAHPTFSGSHVASRDHGIEPGLLFGTLLRIAGADIAVFANTGGRFAFSRDECAGIARRLGAPLGRLLPAWPCPAGGMSFERLHGMCADFGPDAVLLIGGALIGHGDDLEAGTRAYLDVIRSGFEERLEPPRPLRDDDAGRPGPQASPIPGRGLAGAGRRVQGSPRASAMMRSRMS